VKKTNAVRRILIRRVDFLGDLVLSLPVVRAIAANFPHAKVTLMVKPEHRYMFEELHVDGSLVNQFVEPATLAQFKKQALRYDRAFNIEYFPPPEIAKALVADPASSRVAISGIYHVNATHGTKRQHVVRHFFDGLRLLGLAVPRSAIPVIKVSSESKRSVDAWFSENDRARGRSLRIGIHIGSRNTTKCWPLELYLRIAKWLRDEFDATLYFIGSGSERKGLETIIRGLGAKSLSPSIKIVRDESLPVLTAILSRLDLVIGNDSGVSHLAAAVQTPTVSIFGPTSPITWRPAGKRSIVVYNSKQPKRNTNSDVHRSFAGLSVEQVRSGVLLALQLHIDRRRFDALDHLRLAPNLHHEKKREGIILKRGVRGPSCMVNAGWSNVKRILATVERTGSYAKTIERHADASPLLDLLLLHRIILQGRVSRR
jgi:ADP-heptose:LPS heptosyltransferase